MCSAANCRLSGHLVGDGEQCRRHREAKHPGGLEIDHQLVLVRPLYGQVAWFCTAQLRGANLPYRLLYILNQFWPVLSLVAGFDQGSSAFSICLFLRTIIVPAQSCVFRSAELSVLHGSFFVGSRNERAASEI